MWKPLRRDAGTCFTKVNKSPLPRFDRSLIIYASLSDAGYWMSPAEQWERFGNTRSVSCLDLGLQTPSEGEAAQMVPLPPLPLSSMKEQVERCYWALLNTVVRW